jgi:PAS domain S-box-containing protein
MARIGAILLSGRVRAQVKFCLGSGTKEEYRRRHQKQLGYAKVGKPLTALLWGSPNINPFARRSMPFPGKGAVLIELSGRIAFASTYFCDLVGIEHGKIAGMSFFDFVYPEDMDEARKMFEPSKIPSAKPSSLRLRRIDGTAVWAEIQHTDMESAHGEVYAISATVTAASQAITGQKTPGIPPPRNRKFKARLRSLTQLKICQSGWRSRWR